MADKTGRQSAAAPHVVHVLADTFPKKTHHLVTKMTEENPHVLSFSSNGDAFYVYDKSTLAQKYLPQYFKHSKYGSFQRQLNNYGFTSSPHKDNSKVVVWRHRLFHRDRTDQLQNIKDQRSSKKQLKKSHHDVDARPNSTSASDFEKDLQNLNRGSKKPSPTSVSLDSSEEVTSTRPSNNGVFSRQVSATRSFSVSDSPEEIRPSPTRRVSAERDEWLESEIASLHQKLDLLLKITQSIYESKTNDSIEPMPCMNQKPAEAGSEEAMDAFVEFMLSDKEEDAINTNAASGTDGTYEDELMSVDSMLWTNDLGDGDCNLSLGSIHSFASRSNLCDSLSALSMEREKKRKASRR